MNRTRTRLLLVIAVLAGATAAFGSEAATGSAHAARANGGTRLAGTWSGVLSGTVNGTTRHQRITLVVNRRQTGARWKVSYTCRGTLTLDSISGGSHHYLRHVARGGSCPGGDIDCLWRTGTTIYDNVTPRPDGWGRDGTLHRVRTR